MKTNTNIKNILLKIQVLYDTSIRNINQSIEKFNIQIILLTLLVCLFAMYSTLKIWNARIVKTGQEVTFHIPQTDNTVIPPIIEIPPNIISNMLDTVGIIIQPLAPPSNKKGELNASEPLSAEMKFIREICTVAIAEAKAYGIPASIKIAQAALESGWGRDPIATKYNNFYGIKNKKNFSNDEKLLISGVVNRNTKEYIDGKLVTIKDDFLTYDSRWNSIRHNSIFLRGRIDNNANDGYTSMKGLSKDKYKKWAVALEKAGYSTNPNYATTIIKIIEEHKLYQYDK